MPLKVRYCSQCGSKVGVRPEGGRDREVCPNCGTVFYQNPLPVVACVVVDHKRRVLLVKRRQEPRKDMWCLPIGFAETDETVRQAALRELREEAGVEGVVMRLLDADSYGSEFYGDLLVLTFEVEKTGGVEVPGDDALEVAYFSLDALPPLAFASNERAIEALVAVHEEQWGIQDSFRHFQEESGEMLSDPLVVMVEEHAGEIARRWVRELREHPTTLCLRGLDPDHLADQAALSLSRLGDWIRGDAQAEEVSAFYRALGGERAAGGCEVHEVVSSLSLLKRQIYDFAQQSGVWERPADVYRVLELITLVGVFFDKAFYHASRGFAEGDSGAGRAGGHPLE